MNLSTAVVADFAVILTVAAAVTFLFYRIKQPMILGYLVAGVIIGPFTPPFSLISGTDVLEMAANLGVILLLFGVGLQFPLTRLRSFGRVAVGVAAIEIAFMLLISYGLGWAMGWSLMDALFLGTALASSSTVIIAKVLTDMGKLKDTSATIMLSVLVVEDLVVVLLLAGMTSLAGTGTLSFDAIGSGLAKVLGFVVGVVLLGTLVIPRLIDWTAKHGNSEVLVVTALGLCFGLSIVAYLLGFSMAIGGFVMGVLVASAKSADRVAALTLPLRDMFGAMFFVSVGALIDVTQFQTFLVPALAVTVLMVLGKVVGCGLGTRVFGYDRQTSLKVGLGMSQIGEFAFIVMAAGLQLNVVSSSLFAVVGVAAALTTFFTPYLIQLSYRLEPYVGSVPRFWDLLRRRKG